MGFCTLKVNSGAIHANSGQFRNAIGADETHQLSNIFVIIPNATSVTINISLDDDDVVYVFRS